MQGCAPEAVDVSSESPETRKLYGLDDKVTEPFGRQCLMACRLVERGVRFVHLFHGGMGQSRHRHLGCPQQPRGEPPPARGRIGPPHRGSPDGSCFTGSAGFDPRPLARRVWAHADLATRSRPGPQPRDDDRLDGGRENFRGAGRRLERRVRLQGPRTAVSVHDLHTTILHLLGMDHKKLTYRFNGRDIRLTDVYGTPHPADRLLRRRFCPVTRKCFWVYADHSGPLQVADHNAILMPFSNGDLVHAQSPSAPACPRGPAAAACRACRDPSPCCGEDARSRAPPCWACHDRACRPEARSAARRWLS